jgi:hypothetical protein
MGDAVARQIRGLNNAGMCLATLPVPVQPSSRRAAGCDAEPTAVRRNAQGEALLHLASVETKADGGSRTAGPVLLLGEALAQVVVVGVDAGGGL